LGDALEFQAHVTQAARAAKSELSSLLVVGGRGQESAGVGYKAGKSDTPAFSTLHA